MLGFVSNSAKIFASNSNLREREGERMGETIAPLHLPPTPLPPKIPTALLYYVALIPLLFLRHEPDINQVPSTTSLYQNRLF